MFSLNENDEDHICEQCKDVIPAYNPIGITIRVETWVGEKHVTIWFDTVKCLVDYKNGVIHANHH